MPRVRVPCRQAVMVTMQSDMKRQSLTPKRSKPTSSHRRARSTIWPTGSCHASPGRLLKVNFTTDPCCLSDGGTSPRPIIAGLVTRFCVRVHHAGFGFPDLLRLARAAERVGFDGLSLYDVLNPRASEVWTTLTALALATRKLVLMPLVLDVGYRHPSLLAKMAASLDQLSGGGRLILGIGYGGNPVDHVSYGFGWTPAVTERVERLEEQAQI